MTTTSQREQDSLSSLRGKLRGLVWRRALLRIAAAASAFLASLALILLAVFACDVLFDLDQLQRVVVIGTGGAAAIWSFRKLALPLLSRQEDGIDLALLLESTTSAGDDLVAALQFSSPSPRPGSTQLQQAVIRKVASGSNRLEFHSVLSFEMLLRRLAWFSVVVVAVSWILVTNAEHSRVFFQRLMFQSAKYPTATTIEGVFVNSKAVPAGFQHGSDTRLLAIAEATAVDLWVHTAGVRPPKGQVRFEFVSGGATRVVELLPVDAARRRARLASARQLLGKAARDPTVAATTRSRRELTAQLLPDAPDAALIIEQGDMTAPRLREASRQVDIVLDEIARGGPLPLFHARLERIPEPADFGIRIGDAVSELARIELIPLPVVELSGTVTPPPYTGGQPMQLDPGTLQHSVPEGSTVALSLRALNKPLTSAHLVLLENGHADSILDFSDFAGRGVAWSFEQPATELERVWRSLEFEVRVEDRDGLELSEPIRGAIRVQSDQPPAVTLSTVHQVVLPSANPVLDYRVSDDFAVASLRLQLVVTENGGTVRGDDTSDSRVNQSMIPIALPVGQSTVTEFPYVGEYTLELGKLDVVAGDIVSVSLEVSDDRGRSPGQQVRSEPVEFAIADEASVLSTIAAADSQAEKRLTEIIQRQREVRFSQ